jgi:hypothetical protein
LKYLRVTNVRLPINVDFYQNIHRFRDGEEEKKRIQCEDIFLGAIRYKFLQGVARPSGVT